jgi:hypothetical protein
LNPKITNNKQPLLTIINQFLSIYDYTTIAKHPKFKTLGPTTHLPPTTLTELSYSPSDEHPKKHRYHQESPHKPSIQGPHLNRIIPHRNILKIRTFTS